MNLTDKKINVLLISGKKGAGKTVLRKTIQKLLEDGETHTVKLSYADPLKKLAKGIFEYMGLDMEIRADKEFGRPILQTIGHVGRAKSPNFWVEAAYKDIKNDVLNNSKEKVLIVNDDTRFPNEIEYWRELEADGKINKLIAVRITDYTTPDNDLSETALDDYNNFNYYVPHHTFINGDGSANFEKAKEIVEKLLIWAENHK